MYGGDLVDRGVIWLYTVEGVLMFQSNKLYLKRESTIWSQPISGIEVLKHFYHKLQRKQANTPFERFIEILY